MRMKFWLLVGSLVVAGLLVGFFVTRFLNPVPPTIVATTTSNVLQGRPVVTSPSPPSPRSGPKATATASIPTGSATCRPRT